MDIYKEAKPLTIIQIFKESIKLLAKRTLTLPVFLIYISYVCIRYYLNQRVVSPLFAHLTLAIIDTLINKTQKLDFYVPIQKDIVHIIIVESVFNVISFVVSSIFAIATIVVLNEENLTFIQLVSKLRQRIKGPLITKLYIGIFQTGYNSLVLSSFAFLCLIYFPHFNVSFAILFTIQLLILLVILSCLAIVWYVSVVLSVVEEGCYGLVAIGKAAKLIRGKRMQGTAIVLIVQVVTLALLGGYYKIMMDFSRFRPKTLFVVGFVFIGLTSVLSMIVWATSTVFYYDCMRLNGKNTEVAMEGSRVYKALIDSDVDDEVSSKYLVEDKC